MNNDTLPALSGTAIPSAEPTSGWGDLLSGRYAVYALALAGGVTLHAVNVYIATTVMPSVIAEIGGLDFYAWATTLFIVASILGAALTAKLLKGAGPRGAYVLAATLFGLGTLICSLAPSMPVMLAGRIVQGLGGGFLYALAYGVTRLVFPKRLWGRAVGLISAMYGIASLIGPAIGGVFAEYGMWRAAFWSLLPVVALFAALAVATLPKKGNDAHERVAVPFPQLALLTGAILAVSAGSLSPDLAWNLAGLFGAVALTVLIAVVDGRASARLLPRNAFSLATPLGAIYALIALMMIGMQTEIFVPYLLQNLHGQSPLWAGYLAALMAIGWTAASLISARWQEKSGHRLILTGPVLVLVGLVLFALFMPVNAGDGALLLPICAGLVLIGFGIGLAWPSIVSRVFLHAPTAEKDLAAGGMTTVQLFAIAFGTAASGLVANIAGIADPGGVAGATKAAFWLAAIATVAPILGILAALRVVRLTARHV